MSWWEWAAIACFLVGFVGVGAMMAVRLYNNPFLLAGLVPVIWQHMKPAVLKYIVPIFLRLFKRMDPVTEAEWRDCQRRGGKWNYRTRKCE